MQWVIDLLGHQTIGLDSQRHIICFQRDFYVAKIELFQNPYMLQCAFDQSLGCRMSAMFLQHRAIERPCVDADPDRNPPCLCSPHHRADLFTIFYIAGIQPQCIDTAANDFQRQAVIEMNISDQGDRGCLFDRRYRHRCSHIGNRQPDDFTACRLKCCYLSNGCRHIRRFCRCHGLHRNRIIAANRNGTKLHAPCSPAGKHFFHHTFLPG